MKLNCRILLSCPLLLLALAAESEAAYTGTIYLDGNGNGTHDQAEPFIRDVLVSDGLNVVKTDARGSFSLPGHEKARFIFITTPSGYKPGRNHYIRIEGDRESYDFGLRQSPGVKRDGSHQFIHVTDTEIFNTENHDDWLKDLRGYIDSETPAFLIHTGDICYEKGLKEHIKLMNTENMGCPVFYCIGNHDLVDGKYGEEVFEENYGPVYYSFDAGNVHYIVTPMLQGDRQPSYNREQVAEWMKNDLAHVPKDRQVIVFSHDLLTNGEQFNYGPVNLNEHNLKAWIYGHWHVNLMKNQGGIHTICTGTLDKGGIDHSTNAYRVLHIDAKGGLKSELRYSYIDKHLCIACPTESQIPVLPTGAVPVVVNCYDSASPVKAVTYTCSIDGKAVMKNQPLKACSDWSYAASISLDQNHAGQKIQVEICASLSNGEEIKRQLLFTYPGKRAITAKPSGDWLNLLGNPEHIGVTKETLTPLLKLEWVNNVGANIFMSSPLVYNGTVYVASVDENIDSRAHVYALDARTGNLLWKTPVRNSIKNTIAIDSGLVFAQDAEGNLYALNAKTGKPAWEKRLPVKGLPPIDDGLVAHNGKVYAGSGKGLCAFDAKTGKELWRNTGWDQREGTTATLSLSDAILIGSAQWGGLYANNPETGKHLWSNAKEGLRNRASSPSIHGDKVYTVSDDSLFILNAADGNILKQKKLPFKVDVTSTPLVTGQRIIFGTSGSGLVALNKESLEQEWSVDTGNALVFTAPYTRTPSSAVETSPVLSGRTVFIGTSSGTVYGIHEADGKILWKHDCGAPIFSSPAVSGNMLIISDFGGNVYGFVSEQHQLAPK